MKRYILIAFVVLGFCAAVFARGSLINEPDDAVTMTDEKRQRLSFLGSLQREISVTRGDVVLVD